MTQYPMAAYVKTPDYPQVYNWGTKQYDILTKEEYLRKTAEKLRHESAGVTETSADQEAEREPIKRVWTNDAEKR